MKPENLTPFYAVIDHDASDIYICLFSDRQKAIAYISDDAPDYNKFETNGVYDIDSCNKYLQSHNGYIAEIFKGYSLYLLRV